MKPERKDMKVIEILRFNREILERLSKNDIKTDDWEYVDLYNEYEQLRGAGEKVTWIIDTLSEKYGCSERTIHRIISRFKGDVKT
jgi:AraC-like DNA-binding protein